MASVTSLDKDLRRMRLDKYTPGAAREAREWIEGILGQQLAAGDLLEALKDGVALCKLVNLALPPPGIKFKSSAMPFVQMENISHFLRACQQPPLGLQQHDMFLTVDLYESKDPAQVLQCLGAFSRAAHGVKPSTFTTAIGRTRPPSSILSPQSTGGPLSPASSARSRGTSSLNNGSSAYGATRPQLTSSKTGDSNSGRWSPTKSPTSTSSWSRKEHEGSTSPAWNIAQYGYMGGASQGNLGIAFGGRRQITSASPNVPNVTEKIRLRKEREAEEERQRLEAEEERRRQEVEVEKRRLEEERRILEETRQAHTEERRRLEEEKRKWEEQERQWRLADERRRREEEEAEARLAQERRRSRSRNRLNGQYLSEYQADQQQSLPRQRTGEKTEVQRAAEREEEYRRSRQQSGGLPSPSIGDGKNGRARSRSRPAQASGGPSRQDSWSRNDEPLFLRGRDRDRQMEPSPLRTQPALPARPLPEPRPLPAEPPRQHQEQEHLQPPGDRLRTHRTGEQRPPVPVKPQLTGGKPPVPIKPQTTGGSSRPLPDPKAYSNRTDKFLASNPAPVSPGPAPTYSRELGATAERDAEDRRRAQAQLQTRAGGWASKSLVEREMEMDRQRQREWEAAQEETAKAVRPSDGAVDGIGGGLGGRWDVGQWSGYTGGDGQNRGAQGIGAGRRQIVGPRQIGGPRPLPGRP
ncbi:hypothetical protein GGTG_01792 [Gaeumannomyces tritici R3-111a-1]|uniref:Calponin-homology (CH) domain-containing protein n=1 Tax=Gaeumannomyces tritici (strain R3-111a-1) TaxID=644352 RepID=J3NKK1_GAET3|nr:hypothetical protein GGTG_01792 [Gaeumannomyces tritici R3-111a-1]EJT81818.1 hypothetical protein GGTG_01792 [Gaeumannomyces tritici R3-111a-1]